MAINLTNPMTGDAFKTEIENALDKRGDTMDDGATLTLGKNPEGDMDAVPKKYFDDLVYYLNNISPLSVKRDDSGNIVWSSINILYTSNDYLVPPGQSSTNIYGGSSAHFTNVFTIPQIKVGYVPPIRDINFKFLLAFSSSNTASCTVYAVFKDENGNEFKRSSLTVKRDSSSSTYSREFGLDIPLSDKSYSIDFIVTPTSSRDSDYVNFSLREVSERYQLRDIIEY